MVEAKTIRQHVNLFSEPPQKEMLSYSLFFGVPRHHSYFAIQFDAATSVCSVFAIGTVEKNLFLFCVKINILGKNIVYLCNVK